MDGTAGEKGLGLEGVNTLLGPEGVLATGVRGLVGNTLNIKNIYL